MEADEPDPQARRAVERQQRFPMPHSRRGLTLVRLLSRVAMWVRNRDLPTVGATADRTVPGPAGELDARLYLPEGEGPFPTVVFFHGGGYVLGSIATHEWLCRHLTRESGCAFLSATHPDAVGGAERVAVAGDSAGGALAAVAALMAAERDGPAITHQALLYPSVGVEVDQPSVTEHAGLVLTEADMQWFRDCYYENEIHERNPYADPTNACDLSGVAPATVVTAGFDPLRDGGTAYADRLSRDGVPTRHRNYEGMVHGFMTFREVDRARDAIEEVAGDLADALQEDQRTEQRTVQ